MKVGIISKQSHAKSHASALRKEGHTVVMLGGSPTKVPPSIEALVCRPASVSHGGFHTAMGEKKRIPVILANGVSEVLSGIRELQPKEEEKMEVKNSADSVRVLSKLLGIYGHPLHEPKAGPVIEALAAARGEDGQLGFKLWKQALKVCKQTSVRGWAKDEAKRVKEEGVVWAYSYPPRGGVRRVPLFVEDQESLDLVMGRMDLARTEEEAKQMMQKAAEKAKQHREKAQKVTAPPPTPPAPAVEKAPAPPAPAVEKAPAPAPAPAPVQLAWDANLRSALALVISEMKAAGVQSLSVDEKGAVSMQRVVVTELSMQIETD